MKSRCRELILATTALVLLLPGLAQAFSVSPQTTDYPLVSTDASKILPFTCTVACTATIPASTFSANDQFVIQNFSAQGIPVTVVPTSPVVIYGSVLNANGDLVIQAYQSSLFTVDASGNLDVQMEGPVVPNINTQTGTTYTLTAQDCENTVETTSNAPVTITVPTGLPPCYIHIIPIGSGQLTVLAATGFFLPSSHAYTHPFAPYSEITIHITSATTGEFLGDGS